MPAVAIVVVDAGLLNGDPHGPGDVGIRSQGDDGITQKTCARLGGLTEVEPSAVLFLQEESLACAHPQAAKRIHRHGRDIVISQGGDLLGGLREKIIVDQPFVCADPHPLIVCL